MSQTPTDEQLSREEALVMDACGRLVGEALTDDLGSVADKIASLTRFAAGLRDPIKLAVVHTLAPAVATLEARLQGYPGLSGKHDVSDRSHVAA